MNSIATTLILGTFSVSTLAQSLRNNSHPNIHVCPPNIDDIDRTFPDPEHCSKYWDCYNGIATHMTCPWNYLYDPKTQWCDFPEKVYCGERNCDGRPCKQNPDPICDFDCKYDGFFAYPGNCAKYVICQNGKPNCHMCRKQNGQQLMYDPNNNWCDWPNRVQCGERPICDEFDENCQNPHSTTPKTSTSKPSTPRPTNKCQNIDCKNENGSLYPEGKCNHCFCECANGYPFELCCPPGSVFNPALNVCDYPANVNGC